MAYGAGMAKVSAGLLMFRRGTDGVEVFLVHPGGPFWAKKDRGAWGIPKGEVEVGEETLATAVREFGEETGFGSRGPYLELGSVRQAGGKVVTAWGFEGDCDPAELRSNVCEVEWPPRSGRRMEIPEVDRGAWFGVEEAMEWMREAQRPLVDRLVARLAEGV